MDSLEKKLRLGLVVDGLVHKPYVMGNADGIDRAYAACIYAGFLFALEAPPCASNEFTERPVTCLRCAIKELLFSSDVHELPRGGQMVPLGLDEETDVVVD